MAAPGYYYQNQLQFNPAVQTRPINMAVKFHQPQPIVIEKFSHSLPMAPVNAAVMHSHSVLQLSTVSEEQLSLAVQLAKRDLKKQKEAEELEQQATKTKKSKGKIKNTETPKTRFPKKQDVKSKLQKDLPAKKPGKVEKPKTVPSKPLVHMRESSIQIAQAQPWQNNSTMSHEEFTMREIKRLKSEMDSCISQMKKIEEVAKNGKWVARIPPGYEDLPEQDIKKRQAMWAEQQDIRSSRVIYTLQQQVKAIQADLAKVKGPFTQKDRKSFLQRVVGTYRKAVRGLHTLVNQLVDYDLSQGLPRPCHEFQVLMRQLALCTAQLDIASTSDMPDSVKEVFQDILKQAQETDTSLDIPTQDIPPIKQNVIHKEVVTNKQLAGVQQAKSAAESRTEDLQKRANVSEVASSPERAQALRQGIEALLRAAHSPPRQTQYTRPDQSPNRPQDRPQNRPLRLEDRPEFIVERPQKEPLFHRSSQGKKNVAWEVPLGPKQQSHRPSKGLLLPHGLQARRQRQQRQSHYHMYQQWSRARQRQEPVGNMRYAEPTLSSQLRAVPPSAPSPRRPSPGRAVSAERMSGRATSVVPAYDRPSGRELYEKALSVEERRPYDRAAVGRAKSPGQGYSERGRSPRRDPIPGSAQPQEVPYPRKNTRLDGPWGTAQKEIQRQVWLDRDTLKHARNLDQARQAEIAKLKQMRSELLQPTEWVTDTVDKIKGELQPLLDHSGLQLETSADDLADLILQDVLDETVMELQRQRDDGDMEADALLLSNAPSLETMMTRLKDMEREQSEIRQRWATIVYEDGKRARRARFQDTDGSEQPGTPPPLQITNGDTASHAQSRQEEDIENPREVEPLIFTRPSASRAKYEVLHLSQHGVDAPGSRLGGNLLHKPDTMVSLFLTPDIIDRILDNRQRYQDYLQRTSTITHGKFNPWHMVEVMSDEILNECLEDIAKELEEIQMDIAKHIFESEFKQDVNNSSSGTQDQ